MYSGLSIATGISNSGVQRIHTISTLSGNKCLCLIDKETSSPGHHLSTAIETSRTTGVAG